MLKRIIAISFLVLANIIMLAWVIVPHHHHGEAVCFIEKHCQQRHVHDHDHDNSQVPHKHHNHAYCTISESVLPVSVTLKEECTLTKSSFDDISFLSIAPELPTIYIQLVGLPFKRKPYMSTALFTFVDRVVGLRAPPSDC